MPTQLTFELLELLDTLVGCGQMSGLSVSWQETCRHSGTVEHLCGCEPHVCWVTESSNLGVPLAPSIKLWSPEEPDCWQLGLHVHVLHRPVGAW